MIPVPGRVRMLYDVMALQDVSGLKLQANGCLQARGIAEDEINDRMANSIYDRVLDAGAVSNRKRDRWWWLGGCEEGKQGWGWEGGGGEEELRKDSDGVWVAAIS